MTLSLGHINLRSLNKNYYAFREHVCNYKYDVIGLSETWLSDNVPSGSFEFDNYNLIRKDRGTRGGGVAIYIKNSVRYSLTDYHSLNDSFEHLWIKIHINNRKILYGVVYKNKYSGEFLEAFEEVVSAILPMCDNLICMGDFNINLLNSDSNCGKFTNFLENFGLHQIIDEATRICEKTASLLDLIITSNIDFVTTSGVRDTHFSDHSLIFCTINTGQTVETQKYYTFRDFSTFNYDTFLQNLHAIEWNQVLYLDNINSKVEFINNNILRLFNYHAPIKTIKCNKKPAPWCTDNIKVLITLRNASLKRFKRTGKIETWNYYKSLRNLTNLCVKNEKKAFFEQQVRQNNSSSLWRTLKKLDIYSKSKIDLPSHLTNPDEVNDFFIQVFNNANLPDQALLEYYKSNKKPNIESVFQFQLTTTDEVSSILRKLKSRAVGIDGIGVNLLNLCCPFLTPYFTHLFNFCLENSVFPAEWKHSIVIPCPKVKHPTELKHLRPISILPALSKVLEVIMDRQIKSFSAANKLIPEQQSGFRSGHSCTTALLHISDEIFEATDRKEHTALILLDFSKAFDTINHKLLLAMLSYYGFNDCAIVLLDNYLSKRTQQVRIGRTLSKPGDVTSGVPQGSILGPVLFNLYTSLFCTTLKYCRSHFYADDTQLFYSFSYTDADKAMACINSDLDNLYRFSMRHCLNLNAEKSSAMIFGPVNTINSVKGCLKLSINNTLLNFKDSVKNLGVILDTGLRFREHCSHCIKKSYYALKLLYPHKDILSRRSKITLCDSLVLSHFNYADSLYNSCIDSITSKRIQKVQNSCLRFIYGIPRRYHISDKLRDTNWLNMYHRRLLHTACLVYRVISEKTPPYLYQKIRFRTDIHNVNLRNRGNVTIPKHRTELFKRSFSYQAPKIYNGLQPAFLGLSLRTFKKLFGKHLISLQN